MMNEENNIDKLFKEKLQGYSEEPPAFVWEGVKDKLAAGRKKRIAAWYSWVAVAALLVLAFIAGWYFNESSETIVPQTAEKEVVAGTGDDIAEKGNETVEPDDEQEAAVRKQQNAEFLADAASGKPAEKNAGTENEPQLTTVTQEHNTRELITPPEKINRREVNLLATNGLQVDAAGLIAGKARGLSPYEQEIIAQNAALFSEPDDEKKGWLMGVNVSPGYSSYAASYNSEYASNMTRAVSEGNTSVGGGVAIRYRTASRWSVESGVYYAQSGQQAGSSPQLFGGRKDADFYAAPERMYFNTAVKMEPSHISMNSSAGVIEIRNLPDGAEIAANLENEAFSGNSFVTPGEVSQVFDLIEIPLYLRYLLVETRLDVELMGGVNAGVVVGNNAFIDNQFGVQNIGQTRDISTMNLSGTVGLGFNYALGKQFSLALEPRFNYYLNSISRNPEVDFRPYRVGVYTGLYYSF